MAVVLIAPAYRTGLCADQDRLFLMGQPVLLYLTSRELCTLFEGRQVSWDSVSFEPRT